MDAIVQFKQWATKLGCPPESIPSDETLKRSFRDDPSDVLSHIMQKVRSKQEIALMRKNVLVNKLQTHQQRDKIVVNSMLHTLPPELQRFEKIEKLKGKIAETRSRISHSQRSLEAIGLQTKARNAQKLQLQRSLEELRGKTSLYAVHETALKAGIEKETQQTRHIEHIIPARGSELPAHAESPEKIIERCIELLERFYEQFKQSIQHGDRALQEQLWANLREVLRGIPNHLLWSVLLNRKDDLLREISEEDNRQTNLKQSDTFSDHDLLQVGIGKLCTNHITVYLDSVAHRRLVHDTKKDYLDKYTACASELEAKLALLNSMDDEAEEALEDYLVHWNSREYNQGQIQFLTTEIDRKKQEISSVDQKIQNHDQVLAQLRGIYAKIEDISKHMENELSLVRQIKQKVAYSKYMSHVKVRDMRQKNNPTKTTLNISDQSVSRLDSTVAASHGGPAYSPAVLPPLVRELNIFGTLAFAKFTGRSKFAHFYLEPNPAVFCEPSFSVLALLPSIATSADMSVKQFGAMVELEKQVRASATEPCVVSAIAIDHAQLEQRWQGNHGRICKLLDEMELITNGTRQVLDKTRVQYNFAVANSLRKYVPAMRLFNGRSYREYENEYLMYYRMINGVGAN
ncbi:augmin complex subunit dgt5 [Anopheles bellator]|uniref:augmin complex subunit dgt5 n=1 Tax=Anopheles bellator TaxID=139047 RepID=UPI0026477716|nr:augmin complex subunit dgt5 [Anopheles bellator]